MPFSHPMFFLKCVCDLISFIALRMTLVDLVDLSSDDELGELDVRAVKLEAKIGSTTQQKAKSKIQLAKHQISKIASTRRDHLENRSLNASSTGHSNSSILVQGQSPEDTGLSSTVSLSPAPLCRQFWKAGNYNDGLPSKVTHQSISLSTLEFFLNKIHIILR